MRSKIITTVVGILLLGPFMTLGYTDAVSIKQHLQEKHSHIQQLKTESAKLDTQLAKTKETKAAAEAQVTQYQQQASDAAAQSAKLEAELAGN